MKEQVNDIELLIGLKANDENMFKKLFKKYYTPLCLYSVQFTESPNDSEDIVSDFFLHFWEKGFYLQIESNLKSYLFNAIRNLSINYLKTHRRYIFEELEERSLPTPTECTEDDVRENYHHLYEAFSHLSTQEAYAIRSVILQGKSYKEAAREMNISINTLKSYLSRGMKHLRSQLLFSLLWLYILKKIIFHCHPFL